MDEQLSNNKDNGALATKRIDGTKALKATLEANPPFMRPCWHIKVYNGFNGLKEVFMAETKSVAELMQEQDRDRRAFDENCRTIHERGFARIKAGEASLLTHEELMARRAKRRGLC